KGPHNDFVEALETSQGAHDNPLFISISTQAATDGDLFSIWLDNAAENPRPSVVSHVYSAPEGCALDDEDAWAAANPALGVFRTIEDIREQVEKAGEMPSAQNQVRWLFLNQRIEGRAALVSKAEWMACRGDVNPGELYHLPCWGGLDLSRTRDLTAFVMAWQSPGGAVLVRSIAWLPAKGLRQRSEEERVPWEMFAKQGHLRLVDGPVINPKQIVSEILGLVEGHDLRAISYDRYGIKDIERELAEMEASLPLVPHGQGFRDMSPAVDRLERLVALGADGMPGLIHGNQPVLNLCAANAVVEADPAGNRKLTKPKSRGKIDAMVALAMALGGMNMAAPDDTPASSPWDEDPDFTLLA
ncbi:MAG: terminase TerL endonuclease subunit, partial [Pseudomonadota bacterium]